MENLTSVCSSTLYDVMILDESGNTELVESSLIAQHQELVELFQRWGFTHLIHEFLEQEITIERLKYITEADINEIFKNHKLGLKIEFRHLLTNWKIENGITSPIACEEFPPTSFTQRWLNHQRQGDSNSIASGSSASEVENSRFDLVKVVEQFPNGSYVFQVFEKNKTLNETARKILVDAVVSWHIEHRQKFRRDAFESIAKEIENNFKDDKFIYYKKTGPKQNPSGRLYDKYYNNIKRLKKIGLIENRAPGQASLNNSNIETDDDDSDEQNLNECENNTAWLKVNNSPWPDVQEKWKKTFRNRRKFILEDTGDTRITSILADWPLFKHSEGFNLVELDFLQLYHNKGYGLIRRWQKFKEYILPIFNSKIKDKQNLTLLKNLNRPNHTEDVCDVIVALLIHALVPPTIKHYSRKADKSKKVIIKSAIKDSQDSFLVHARTLNDFEKKIDDLKSTLLRRGETLQPITVVVGDDLINIDDCYLYYDNIKYKFQNYLAALDSCFKIFHVLNLKYPKCSENVWIFIQKYFYEIDLPDDNPCPSLLCLLSDLTE